MPLAPGATLGAYRIISSVGSGGMGDVYRAHDTRLGRDVALKILPDTLAASADHCARFEREARAVAALNHPHIVTIYSTEHERDLRFLTMELVDGQTLDRLIPAAGLPLAQFFDIAVALADALQAAHQKHITHRDLKPSNVMVTSDGRVKVLDFGLASAAEAIEPDPAGITKPAIDAGRHYSRHSAVHVAGTDRSEADRPPQRPLLARHRALRDGRRPAALRRRFVAGADVVNPARRAARRSLATARRAGRTVAPHRAVPEKGGARSDSIRRRRPMPG